MARKQDPGAPIAFLLYVLSEVWCYLSDAAWNRTVNGIIRMDVDNVFNFRMVSSTGMPWKKRGTEDVCLQQD